MPTIAQQELDLARQDGQRSELYMSVGKWLTLWTMRVNGTQSRGEQDIPFDTGAGLDFSAIADGQTVWFGLSAGENDVGHARIQSVSSGDAGVTGTLTIDPNPLILADTYYITIIHNYELWPWYPFIDGSEDFFKNGDIAFSDQTSDTEPVAVVNLSHRAGFIRNGWNRMWIDCSNSYATKPGESISSYSASVYPSTGATLDFNTSTGIGYIAPSSAIQDYYWLTITVTDSNGESQTTHRCVFGHSLVRANNTFPHIDFSINQLDGDWERGGWSSQVIVDGDGGLDDIPDNTFVVLWRERYFNFANEVTDVRSGADDDSFDYVNPVVGYSTVPNGSNVDITVTFYAGIRRYGQLVANGTTINADMSVNSGTPVAKNDTTTDSMVSISHTFTNEPTSGTILVEDINNINVFVSDTYEAGSPKVESATYPSQMITYPNNLIVGYMRNENIQTSYTAESGRQLDTFRITTIEELLKNQFMFSVSMASRPDGDVNKWYEYRKELTIGRASHHMFKWHSNLLEVADVVGLLDNTDGRAYAEFEGGTLYTMPDNMARNHGIRAHFVCNKHGQLHLTQDAQLLVDADRAGLDFVAKIDKEDRSDELGLLRNTEDRVAFVYGSGLVFSENYSLDENGELMPDVEPYCATAPGAIPSGDGEGTINLERQVITSQDQLNKIVGRVFAQQNNEYPELRINFHGDYLDLLDIHLAEFWTMDLAADDTVRGVEWTDQNLIPRHVNVLFGEGNHLDVNASFEPEEDAQQGVSAACFGTLPVLPGVPVLPPVGIGIPGFGGSIIDGTDSSSVYFLPSGDFFWENRKAGDIFDLGVDPFWQTKQGSTDPEDAIVIRGGVGLLERSDDAGKTWSSVISGLSNPPADSNGDLTCPFAAPLVSECEFRSIEGNTTVANEFYIGVSWPIPNMPFPIWHSWVLQTLDDFSTYTWWEMPIFMTRGSSSMVQATRERYHGGVVASSVKLTSTLYFMASSLNYNPGTPNDLLGCMHGSAVERSGTTMTHHSPTAPSLPEYPTYTPGPGEFDTFFQMQAYKISGSTAGIASRDGNGMNMRSFNVSGSGAIWLNSWNHTGLANQSFSGDCWFTQSGDDGEVFMLATDNDGSTKEIRLFKFTPGSEGTTPTSFTVASMTPATTGNLKAFEVFDLGGGQVMCLYMRKNDGETNERLVGKIVTTGFTAGSEAEFWDTGGTGDFVRRKGNQQGEIGVALSNNRAAFVVVLTDGSDGTHLMAFSYTDQTIDAIGTDIQLISSTSQTPFSLATPGGGIVMKFANAGTWNAIGYDVGLCGDDELSIDNRSNLTTLTSSTSTPSFTNGQVHHVSGDRYVANGYRGDGANAFVFDELADPLYTDGQDITSLSVDKFDGDNVWVAGRSYNGNGSGDDFSQKIVNTTINPSTRAMSHWGYFTMGANVTSAQLNTRQYNHAVACDPQGAVDVYVFGRMNTTPDNVHLWHYDSGGAGFTDQIDVDDFGTDYIGQIIPFADGTYFLVRCTEAVKTQLYSGVEGGSFTLLSSDVGIPGGVFNKGFDYGSTDGVVVIGNIDGSAIMVVGAISPFTQWWDLTYDHGVTGGIRSLIILE